MKIIGIIPARLAVMLVAIDLLFASASPAFAQRNALEIKPPPMKRAPDGTNSSHWHTLAVMPKPGLPEIHCYNKLNPVWWLENADEPVPPAWYLSGDKHRGLKWRFRNPFHNFDFYVIGVADKKFVRSGRHPERNSSPHGGWDFELARRRLALLPFISYERQWCTFYFGWREHGAFGLEFRLHHKPSASSFNTTAH